MNSSKEVQSFFRNSLRAGRAVIQAIELHQYAGECCFTCLLAMVYHTVPKKELEFMNQIYDRVGIDRGNLWLSKLNKMADRTKPSIFPPGPHPDAIDVTNGYPEEIPYQGRQSTIFDFYTIRI